MILPIVRSPDHQLVDFRCATSNMITAEVTGARPLDGNSPEALALTRVAGAAGRFSGDVGRCWAGNCSAKDHHPMVSCNAVLRALLRHAYGRWLRDCGREPPAAEAPHQAAYCGALRLRYRRKPVST
jgi:hypothetical protein